MPLEPTRRSVLLAGAGLMLAACGDKKKVIDATNTTSGGAGGKELNVLLASFQPLVGPNQRVAFAVLDGEKPLRNATEVDVSFSLAAKNDFSKTISAQLHESGIEARPFFVATPALDTAGPWVMRVKHKGRQSDAALQVFDPATLEIPVPGQPMISTPTPTPSDSRGVDPICTRDPVCPWHDVSLDDALKEDKPVVVLFATPALCQSSTCGPVLDILLKAAPEFADKVRFVHVEIFTDMTGKTLAPAVKAYHLENEPFLFLADRQGIVQDRIDGPLDLDDARSYLRRLVALS